MKAGRRLMPAGAGLPEDVWRGRHRAITGLAWAHAVGVPVYGIAQHRTASHALLEAGPIAAFALLATIPGSSRRLRAAAASAALLTSSAILVHFSNGLIEMHFHFFVMVPIVALYQDWVPFLLAIAYVFAHHGFIGAIAPDSVFNHAWGRANPWRWAVVHAIFIAGTSAVCLATWRLNDAILARQRRAEHDLLGEKQIVETLHSVGSGIVAELNLERVSQMVTDAAVKATGAAFGAFFYNVFDTSGDRYMLYTLSGAPRSAFDVFPMPRNTKIFEPTFSGTATVRIDDVGADERYGHNEPYNGMPPGHLPVRSYLAIPVRSRGSSEVLGGLFFGHPEPGVFTEAHERIASGIATQAAIAFDNAALYQAERTAREGAEDARARLSMLADVGRLLVASLDPDTTLRNLAQITVPTLADVCIIDMLDDDNELKRVAVFVANGLEDLAASIEDQGPKMNDATHPVVHSIQTGEPKLFPEITPDLVGTAAVNDEHADAMRRAGGLAAIIVPLVGRGNVLGAISFATTAVSGRSFDLDDLPLAEVLGRRAGMAVENARLFQAERDARETADRATRRLALLAETGRLIAATLDEDVALQHLAEVTVPTLADVCLIDVITEEGAITRIATGAPGLERFATGLSPFPPGFDDMNHPVIRVMRTGEPLLVEEISPEFLDSITKLPQHREAAERLHPQSTIIVPLTGHDRTYGAITLINIELSNRAFDQDDFALVEEIGRRAGIAIDNARLYRAERDALSEADVARGRLTLLADASRVLASSLDVDTTLRHIATLTIPRLADICVIDMVTDSGEIRRVVIESGPGLEKVTYEIATHPPARSNSIHPVVRVLDSREALLIENLSPKFIKDVTHGQDHEVKAVAAEALTTLTVPLHGRTDVLGTITLATTTTSGRRFTTDDIPLSEELGRRAGIAIENARLFSQQRTVAESLQHALLPQQLPDIPGFAATARYMPGSPGERVGGDWYDLFEMPTGEIAIVMGDVVGHGIAAASLMAQLRNALRAYVWDGVAPAEVLGRLNQLLYGLEPEGMATVSLGILDPVTSRLRLSNAGHPPILLIRGGASEYVGEGLGPPLGAIPFARYRDLLLELRPNDTAVFYTDGLVETRTASIDQGLELMRTAVAGNAGTIHELSDGIVAACLGDRIVEDDIALLVLRSLPLGTTLSLTLPTQPRVLSSLRQTLRRWLHEHDIGGDEADDVLIAVGEACNNAIEHGSASLHGSFELEATMNGDLNVLVRSVGAWRPSRNDGGGRGLPVMNALMDDVQIERGADSIEVRLRRRLGTVRQVSGTVS